MRRVVYYIHPEFDAGLLDSPELENPQEQDEGFLIDIVHNIRFVDGKGFNQSEILIEKDDHEIVSILPKQLIRFVE